MGLDQSLHFELTFQPDESTEIQYWRKHPNLQGMIEGIWTSRGPQNTVDNMNCERVYLTEQDIVHILEMIKSNKLPDTQGFFYGSDSSDHYRDEDLKAFESALRIVQSGQKVYYHCWW